ncbi:MAG: 3-keto-disaccharide hydrolase [Fimbriiglobus sp.]
MRFLCALALTAAVAVTAAPAAEPVWKLDDEFKAAKPDDLVDAKPTPPPPGAVVLFDGKSLDSWVKRNGGGEVQWKLADGTMEGVKGHGDIVTKEKFGGKFTLHVEFRIPYEPAGKGQGKGNSGVYVQGRYEVQVLDSYGLKSGKNDCAAIYDVAAPSENACKAPTVWQTYDIEFAAPVFENGKKTEPTVITVTHNGVKVHDAVKVPRDNTTAGLGGDASMPGPILLQDHGHPVQYRNVWLLPAK